MLTGALKNKVDSIWEMFWTGGITNPPRCRRTDDLSYVHSRFG